MYFELCFIFRQYLKTERLDFTADTVQITLTTSFYNTKWLFKGYTKVNHVVMAVNTDTDHSKATLVSKNRSISGVCKDPL